MSSASDAYRERRRRWGQYLTQPAPQAGQSPSMALTVPGAVSPYKARNSEAFLADTAKSIDFFFVELEHHREWLERHARALEALRSAGEPAPLVPHALRVEAEALRYELTGPHGIVERVVALEFAVRQDPHAHEAAITGLVVAGALVSAASALVCVAAAVSVWWGGP